MPLVVTSRLDRPIRRSISAELGCRHAGAKHPLGGNVAVVDRQAAERRPQGVERQPEIEQRAEHHVARTARKNNRNTASSCRQLVSSFPSSRRLQ